MTSKVKSNLRCQMRRNKSRSSYFLVQKISPEGKAKIQLQLVLHDGNSSTFHFVNRAGAQQQIADREKVKDLIQSILPNFKRKIDTELEEKNRLLTENPRLLQLYKDLVISQIFTSEEFWKIHGKDLQNLKSSTSSKQEIGVSGAFLSEIRPETDGANGLKYNLTGEMIECIFKAYPAVKRKHLESVPAKLSESEFWTKFFQSHYFHRDRITAGVKDIFSECGRIDDSTLRKEIRSNLDDPLQSWANLGKFGDNTIEEGFCSSNSGEQKTDNNTGGNIVHQSIIKRFNQHSFMVLKSCQEKPATVTAPPSDDKKADEKDKKLNGSTTESGKKRKQIEVEVVPPPPPTPEELADQQLKKKKRIMEKIHFDDLGLDVSSDNSAPTQSTSLNLERLERYLYGPTPSTSTSSHNVSKGHEHLADNVDQMIREHANEWGQRVPHKQLISPANAVSALGELSPGGLLMRGYQDQNLSQFVPVDIEKEINHLYMSACELLREFWSCFPPTNQDLEAKAVKMQETLQRFNMSKIKPFEDRVTRELSPLGTQIVSHINLLIETAFMKFNNWQDRKVHKLR